MKLPLRIKILILFLLVASLFLLSIFSSSLIKGKISSQIKEHRLSLIKSASKIVEHYILSCQRSLLALSSAKSFRENVEKENKVYVRRSLRRVYRKYKTFSFVSCIKKKGKELKFLSVWPYTYEGIIKDKEFRNFVLKSFKFPRLRISKVMNYRGRNEVLILVPMRKAVLVAGINLKNLSELLLKIRPSKKSKFALLDWKGNYIVGGKGEFEYKIPSGEGFIEKERENIFITSGTIPVFNWNIVLISKYTDIFSPVLALKRLTFFFLILGIAIAIILSIHFSKKITEPIYELMKGARILGSGNLSYRIKLKTGDELEKLADAFNKMAEELKKSYDLLDERVKMATRNLQEAYQEIEEKNRKLEEADKLKSQFLANMSHELRTPLNAIIGFTDLIMSGIYGKVNNKQYEKLERVKINAEHLLNLINDILDLSKIEAGRMELFPERFKVNSLIEEIKSSVEGLVQEKGLELRVNLFDEIEANLDPRKFRQIILNLVSNAIKFTKEGYVEISLKKRDGEFEVAVKDTGIGIKEEDLKHIFDEFRQVDGSTAREFGGTGLGLSISKKLTELMGGRIEVESKYGKGSTFKIIFPIYS